MTAQPLEYGYGEFDRELESERARWLCRRFTVFCALWVASDVATMLLSVPDLNRRPRLPPTPAEWEMYVDGTSTLVGLSALFYAWFGRPPTATLFSLSYWLTVIGGALTVLWARGFVVFDGDSESNAVDSATGLPVSVLVLHLLACLLFPWTLRESLRPAVILLALVACVAGVDVMRGEVPVPSAALFVLLSALAVVPGAFICWMRYSRFRKAFTLRFESALYRRLQSELTSARRVHESCLPPRRDDGPVRLNYVYEPMRQIGGDLLFVHPPPDAMRDGSGTFSAVILDVTGHGIAAALTVNRLVGELERLFSENAAASPGDVLRGLNRYVTVTLSRYELYATALCVRVDPVRDVLEWASGGHPPAFLRRADGRVEPLDSTAPMLGVLEPDEYDPEPARTPLGPGDVLIGYTDGASEAADGRGEQLGTAGVQRLLSVASSDGVAPTDWPAVMLKSLSAHRGGPPEDDTLIVAVCRAAG